MVVLFVLLAVVLIVGAWHWIETPVLEMNWGNLTPVERLFVQTQEYRDLSRGRLAYKVSHLTDEPQLTESRVKTWVKVVVAVAMTLLPLLGDAGSLELASASPAVLGLAVAKLMGQGRVAAALRKVCMTYKQPVTVKTVKKIVLSIEEGRALEIKGIGPATQKAVLTALIQADRELAEKAKPAGKARQSSRPASLKLLASQASKARDLAQEQNEDIEVVLVRKLAQAMIKHGKQEEGKDKDALAKQIETLMDLIHYVSIETWGRDCLDASNLLLGKGASEKASEEAHIQWLIQADVSDFLVSYHWDSPMLVALRELGHLITFEDEMKLAHAGSPLQLFDKEMAEFTVTAKSDIGSTWLQKLGYSCYFRVSKSRSLWSSDRQYLKGVEFMGSQLQPMSKALKGHKYAKSLLGPMDIVSWVDIRKNDVIIAPEYEVIEEAFMDGQVLVAASVVEEAVRSSQTEGHARKSWLKPVDRLLWSVFICRFYIPELGLVKGGAVIVPDSFLNFGGRQYKVIASEVKTEVVVEAELAIFGAASKCKRPKAAATDLQNFLMSLDINSGEVLEGLSRLIQAQKAEKEKGVDSWLEQIQEDAEAEVSFDDLSHVADVGLKEVAIAKVLQASGVQVNSIPALFGALMSQAGDGNFDSERLRLQGKLESGVVWRETHYLTAHPGRVLLGLEILLGRLRVTEEQREWLESWEGMKVQEIQVSNSKFFKALDEHGTSRVYVTRRPMTLSGGAPMELVSAAGHPEFGAAFVAPIAGMPEHLLVPSDGADFDDAFELNFGEFGALMTQWGDQKSSLFQDKMDGEEVVNFLLEVAGKRSFFGLSISDHIKDWSLLSSSEVRKMEAKIWNSHKKKGRAHKPFGLQALHAIKEELSHQGDVDPVDLWSKATVLEEIASWTGSAANAQMFATFILQGYVFGEQHPFRQEAVLVAKGMVSIMLSDVIDATQQGVKIEEACNNMQALQVGMLMLSEYALLGKQKLKLPEPAKSRAMWTFKNLLSDVTYPIKENGEFVYKVVGGRKIKATNTFNPGNLKYDEDCWPMYNLVTEYVAWFKEWVEGQLQEGAGTRQMQRLGEQAAHELIVTGENSRDRSLLNDGITKAQLLRASRSQLVSINGLSDDSVMIAWANAPMDDAMGECLDKGLLTREVMLLRMSTWQRYNIGNIEVSIDPSTLGIRLKNAGERTAMYGDVKEMEGLWRYFIKFIRDLGDRPVIEHEMTVYPLDRKTWADSDKNTELLEGCKTFGEVLEHFGPVSIDNPNATPFNANLTKMKRSKNANSKAAIERLLETYSDAQVTRYKVLYNEDMDCWEATVYFY